MKRNRDSNLLDSGKRSRVQNDEWWEDDSDIMFTQDDLQTLDAQEKQCLDGSTRSTLSNGLAANQYSSSNASLKSSYVPALSNSTVFVSSHSQATLSRITSANQSATTVSNGSANNNQQLNVVTDSRKVDLLEQKIKQLEDEKRKLIEEQYAKDGNITMMKTSVAAKDEQLRQLLEEKSQREKMYVTEKAEREKKHAEELQKLQCQLMFERKEKSDERDAHQRLLKQQQRHEADNTLIPPTQEASAAGRSRAVSCSPHKPVSSPARRLSLANHSNKRPPLDNKFPFPSEQTFREAARDTNRLLYLNSNLYSRVTVVPVLCTADVSRQKCVRLVRYSKLLDLASWPTNGLEGVSKEEEEAVRLACHGVDLVVGEAEADIGAVYLLPAVDACLTRSRRQLASSTPSPAASSDICRPASVDSKLIKRQSQSSSVRGGPARIGSRHASVCASNHTSQLSESQLSIKTTADSTDDDSVSLTITLLRLLTHLLSWHPHLTSCLAGSPTDHLMQRVSSNSQLLASKVKALKIFDQVLDLASPNETSVLVVCESLQTISVVINASRHVVTKFSGYERVCQQAGCFSGECVLADRAVDVLLAVCVSGGVNVRLLCASSTPATPCTMMAMYRYFTDLDLCKQDSRTLLCKVFALLSMLLNNQHYGPALLLQANCHCSVTVVRTLIMVVWRLVQLSSGSREVLCCIQQGLRLLHDLYLKDVHWLAHKRDVKHYFTNLCIRANHLLTVSKLTEDLQVLADMYDMREEETEATSSRPADIDMDTSTDNCHAAAASKTDTRTAAKSIITLD